MSIPCCCLGRSIPYRVEQHDGELEIRRYPCLIVASTKVRAETASIAVDHARQVLSPYATLIGQVLSWPPVLIEQLEPAQLQEWCVSLIVQAGTQPTPPKPQSAAVYLQEIPAHRVIVSATQYTSLTQGSVALTKHKLLSACRRRDALFERHKQSTAFVWYRPSSFMPSFHCFVRVTEDDARMP